MVDGVKIYGGQSERLIHLGTQIRLVAQPYLGGSPLSFSQCPFSFSWRSRSDVQLKIVHPLQLEKEDQTSVFLQVVNASALETGKVEVQVTMDQMKAAAHFTIIEPLTTNLPSYVMKEDGLPHLLLIPPHSGYRL